MGKGDPLYMRITKSIYDNNMDKNSVMCMINPTALVDNKYMEADDKNYDRYKDLRLVDFYYNSSIRGVFTSADIGNDLAIFTYRKDGKMSIFDDDVKEIRFKNHKKDKRIIDLIHGSMPKWIKESKFIHFEPRSHEKAKDLLTKFSKGNNYVIFSYIRGNLDKKTGGHKWDWTTLMNSVQLVVQEELPETAFSAIDFNEDRNNAVELIKWVNTDFIMFIVDYYKFSTANQPVLFKHLPQPPASGDFSDESLMKEFGLTEDQMKHIHKKMKDYGWKTRELIPDHKESSLLQFIDDLNNGKAKLPESKKGKKKESDSSLPTSVSSKTVIDNR